MRYPRLGHVTGAAEAFRLTPSAVSQQLGKLQRDVGQRLIEPYGRGVRLDACGHAAGTASTRHPVRGRERRERARPAAQHVIGEPEIAGFATAARAILPQTVAAAPKAASTNSNFESPNGSRMRRFACRCGTSGYCSGQRLDECAIGVARRRAASADHERPWLILPCLLTIRSPGGQASSFTELSAEPWITWPYGATLPRVADSDGCGSTA